MMDVQDLPLASHPLVLLVNIVLGIEEENLAGDLNQDGLYNVLDIVLLVNIILQ